MGCEDLCTRPAERCADSSIPYGLALQILGSGRLISVDAPTLTIGTSPSCDVVLVDPYVSKQHCTLRCSDGQLVLVDEASRNGTWVNNVRIESCILERRARIDVGQTRLQLCSPTLEGHANEHGLVGDHSSMRQVYELIVRFGAGRFPVLLTGETGTGKELVARAIHESSAVAGGPFEALNCAAIPRELAESELFGHVRGAFTGAVGEFCGAFARAEGGTLFLDEVGEMPLELQPKLLRVLEDGVVRPVGAARGYASNVRIVAATHRDLERAASRDRFRIDLFYRLAVGTITLPTLRERSSDIGALVAYFIKKEGSQQSLEPGVLQWLEHQPWPGNVRALRHAIQRALVLCDGPTLCREHFLAAVGQRPLPLEHTVDLRGQTFAEIRAEVFRWALEQHEGNRSAAARQLGIPKTTFSDQLRGIGL